MTGFLWSSGQNIDLTDLVIDQSNSPHYTLAEQTLTLNNVEVTAQGEARFYAGSNVK
ncbi:MAG: hypothetical protein JEZ03_03285, partial [Bacteroidales bacterium]|nr:hypothetical protein [Bacteroidales bacterium]